MAGELNFVELPRPRFAYSWQLIDDCQACNQDGQAQRGETVSLLLDVTNVGGGKALDTFAIIRNAGEPNIFIEKGRFKVGELEVGETKTARFALEVKKALKADEFGLRVNVLDEPLEEFLTDKLVIPVDSEGAPIALEPRKGVVKVAEKAEVYGSADARAAVIARLPKGAVLTELARGASVARVELAENRTAFVKVADLRDARGQKPVFPKDKELEVVPFRAPAQISINLDPTQGGTAIDGANFTLSSVVSDPSLLDVFVLVNDQKVFFKGRTPEDGDKLKFTTEFPLKEGNNFVTVIARETQDFATRKTVVIRRRAPAVAANVSDSPPKQAKP
jgi:carboxyl-terminal processing protease